MLIKPKKMSDTPITQHTQVFIVYIVNIHGENLFLHTKQNLFMICYGIKYTMKISVHCISSQDICYVSWLDIT